MLQILEEAKLPPARFEIALAESILVEGRDQALAITEAVMSLRRALKLSIVTEGVETVEQLTILSSRSCAELQGYLFPKPLPVDAVPRIIDHALEEILRKAVTGGRKAIRLAV